MDESPSNKEDVISKDQLDRLWQHYLSEGEIFNHRFEAFVALEAMLFTVVALLISHFQAAGQHTSFEKFALKGVMALALLLSAIWAYTQGKERYVHNLLQQRLAVLMPEFYSTLAERKSRIWKLSNLRLLSLVPYVFVGIWIAMQFVI